MQLVMVCYALVYCYSGGKKLLTGAGWTGAVEQKHTNTVMQEW